MFNFFEEICDKYGYCVEDCFNFSEKLRLEILNLFNSKTKEDEKIYFEDNFVDKFETEYEKSKWNYWKCNYILQINKDEDEYVKLMTSYIEQYNDPEMMSDLSSILCGKREYKKAYYYLTKSWDEHKYNYSLLSITEIYKFKEYENYNFYEKELENHKDICKNYYNYEKNKNYKISLDELFNKENICKNCLLAILLSFTNNNDILFIDYKKEEKEENTKYHFIYFNIIKRTLQNFYKLSKDFYINHEDIICNDVKYIFTKYIANCINFLFKEYNKKKEDKYLNEINFILEKTKEYDFPQYSYFKLVFKMNNDKNIDMSDNSIKSKETEDDIIDLIRDVLIKTKFKDVIILYECINLLENYKLCNEIANIFCFLRHVVENEKKDYFLYYYCKNYLEETCDILKNIYNIKVTNEGIKNYKLMFEIIKKEENIKENIEENIEKDKNVFNLPYLISEEIFNKSIKYDFDYRDNVKINDYNFSDYKKNVSNFRPKKLNYTLDELKSNFMCEVYNYLMMMNIEDEKKDNLIKLYFLSLDTKNVNIRDYLIDLYFKSEKKNNLQKELIFNINVNNINRLFSNEKYCVNRNLYGSLYLNYFFPKIELFDESIFVYFILKECLLKLAKNKKINIKKYSDLITQNDNEIYKINISSGDLNNEKILEFMKEYKKMIKNMILSKIYLIIKFYVDNFDVTIYNTKYITNIPILLNEKNNNILLNIEKLKNCENIDELTILNDDNFVNLYNNKFIQIEHDNNYQHYYDYCVSLILTQIKKVCEICLLSKINIIDIYDKLINLKKQCDKGDEYIKNITKIDLEDGDNDIIKFKLRRDVDDKYKILVDLLIDEISSSNKIRLYKDYVFKNLSNIECPLCYDDDKEDLIKLGCKNLICKECYLNIKDCPFRCGEDLS